MTLEETHTLSTSQEMAFNQIDALFQSHSLQRNNNKLLCAKLYQLVPRHRDQFRALSITVCVLNSQIFHLATPVFPSKQLLNGWRVLHFFFFSHISTHTTL